MTLGKFIVLEGIDGSGLTTQSQLLANSIPNSIYTKEPTTSQIGAIIRKVLTKQLVINAKALALLFTADRLLHCHEVIKPALEQGTNVICDRYIWSTLTYQYNYSEEVLIDWLVEINCHIVIPDLIIYLAIDLETAKRRRLARQIAYNQSEELYDTDLEAIQKYYQNLYDMKETPLTKAKVKIAVDGLDQVELLTKLRELITQTVDISSNIVK